jgi:hypothetical protein
MVLATIFTFSFPFSVCNISTPSIFSIGKTADVTNSCTNLGSFEHEKKIKTRKNKKRIFMI